MCENFEEARVEALKVINKLYGGDKMGCCVVETKESINSRKTRWGFRFYSKDTNGEFVPNGDGSYSRLYTI